MISRRHNLAAKIVRRWPCIAAAWLVSAVVLVPLAGKVEKSLDAAAHIAGAESSVVAETIRQRFDTAFAETAILVVTGVPAPDTAVGRVALHHINDAVNEIEGVDGTLSYLDTTDPYFLGADGGGTFVIVGLKGSNGGNDALISRLRAATTQVAENLRARYPHLALRWTGEAPLNVDIREASSRDVREAELRVLPVTLVLLLAAFGTMSAALLPLLAAMVTLPIVLGITALLSQWGSLSILLVNVVTMIGLGLGIDYALLIVSRYREARRSGREPRHAAEDAARHAGRTVFLSGTTVAISFAALLFIPLNEIQSIAVGGLLVVAVTVLLSASLLPGLLARLGARIDGSRIHARIARLLPAIPWRRWGAHIVTHPFRVLLVAGTPLILLAVQAARMNVDLPRGDWLPHDVSSVQAVHDLETMGRRGIIDTIRVLVELPPGTTIDQETGWSTLRRVGEALGQDPRIDRVRSVAAIPEFAHFGHRGFALLPPNVVRDLVSRDKRLALVDAIPHNGIEASDLVSFVNELRGMDPSALTGLPGTRLRIGGLPAFNADYRDAVAGWLPTIVGLVVLATFFTLAVVFRSVLIPLKAVALNVVSVAAAFGAVVLVFQDGYGAVVLGLDGATGGVFPIVPVLVFCTVFGLSMDYELFLITRVAEARRRGLGDAEAIVEGLERTGGVITSAAAVMIAVFAAFVLGDFLLMKMLGFALAVAVLIDATLVRLAVGPALIRLAGRWNWWPGDVCAANEPGHWEPVPAAKEN